MAASVYRPMTSGHDRRAFFRELLRGASRAAGELDAMRDWSAETAGQPQDLGVPEMVEPDPAPVAAAPVQRTATIEDLRRVCAELGREAWADEAASLSRSSIRLTAGDGEGSWLGGAPVVPAGFDWPMWNGAELAFLAQITLDELRLEALPREGSLLLFFALDDPPSGLQPAHAAACRVVHVRAGSGLRVDHVGALPERSVTTSVELMLPIEPVTLALEPWQLDGWTDLREGLARIQGVVLEERSDDYHALHRLLGYPETFAEEMELDAELLTHGIDLEDDPWSHPLYEELEPGAAEWRLLLQLSNDDEIGIALGSYERLFVWIRDDDLRAARFDRVRAFVR